MSDELKPPTIFPEGFPRRCLGLLLMAPAVIGLGYGGHRLYHACVADKLVRQMVLGLCGSIGVGALVAVVFIIAAKGLSMLRGE